MRFYDASAVAKAYLDEPETNEVKRLMASADLAICRLSQVEVASAINRRWREGLMSAARRDLVTTSFFDDARGWTIIELTESVVSHAAELLRRHPLRAGDAVQLASGLAARAITGKDFGRFVAYDERLLTAARAEGLPIEEY